MQEALYHPDPYEDIPGEFVSSPRLQYLTIALPFSTEDPDYIDEEVIGSALFLHPLFTGELTRSKSEKSCCPVGLQNLP